MAFVLRKPAPAIAVGRTVAGTISIVFSLNGSLLFWHPPHMRCGTLATS